jgi:hypothetical protein
VPDATEEVIQPTTRKGNDEAPKDNNLHVVCFNCGQIGHLSSACNKPKVCFICRSTEHIVDLCNEWKKLT